MTSHYNAKRLFSVIFSFIFLVILTPSLNAEIISDEVFGFSLDIPEGFKIEGYSDDSMTWLFSHPNIPVHFIMKIVDDASITTSKEALSQNLDKLSAKKEIDTFTWNQSECAISQFSMNLEQPYQGWSLASPLKQNLNYLVLICYAPEEQKDECGQFILSLLNSLNIDTDYYNTPGIILSYAFPSEGKKKIQLNIGGTKINTSIDKADQDAAQFLIDMEFSVFKLYASHPLWKEAWQRYYRLVFRDNYGRIQGCMQDVLTSLEKEAEKSRAEDKDLYIAQKILSWTQGFSYTRTNTSASNSDLTSLPDALCGKGNDCDSRSMLVCAFMREYGKEAILLISREYSHAMCAVQIDAPGQKFIPEGTDIELLMGETTAQVTWGMIAQDMADRSKWIPVYLP